MHPMSIEQTITTSGTPIGVNRDARSTQRVHIAVNGPQRNLAFGGKRLRGNAPAGLQGIDDEKELARAHDAWP